MERGKLSRTYRLKQNYVCIFIVLALVVSITGCKFDLLGGDAIDENGSWRRAIR